MPKRHEPWYMPHHKWHFCYGEPFTRETEDKILEMLKPSHIQGLTLLGGEPFEPQNQKALLLFVKRVRETFPEKDIWAFSGFTFEEMNTQGHHANCDETKEILSLIDILVDGKFKIALKDISLKFRGSSNQRIIDVKKTLETGIITIWDKLEPGK